MWLKNPHLLANFRGKPIFFCPVKTRLYVGEPSGLPYDVSLETALGYEEVQKRLEKSISILKKVSTMFLSTITNSVPRLPYGILYIAKVKN